MNAPQIQVRGELLGRRRADPAAAFTEEIVRIPHECRPEGPGKESMLAIRTLDDGQVHARYLPWIPGYRDLDLAAKRDPEGWQLVEPPEPYEKSVLWDPYDKAGLGSDL